MNSIRRLADVPVVVAWLAVAALVPPTPAQRRATAAADDPARATALCRALADDDRAVAATAARRLVAMGSAAVPALERAYGSAAGPTGADGESAGGEPADDDSVGDAAAIEHRVRILGVLGRLGADGAAAVPWIVAELGSADGRLLVASLLCLEELAPYAPDDADAIRAVLQAGIGNWHRALIDDHDAAEGLPRRPGRHRRGGAIMEVFQSYFRIHARLELEPDTAMPELIAALQHDNPFVREWAAELLGRRGPAARAAIDALIDTAHSDDHPNRVRAGNASQSSNYVETIQAAARVAIARIAPDDAAARRGLRELLELGTADERVGAAMALGRHGAEAADAVGALRAALDDPDPRLVAECITSLGMIGPAAGAAAEELRGLAAGDDKALAARARAALRLLEDREHEERER